jgi:hypothetical protein
MDCVEMLPDNSFLVSEERVNNSLFKEILKNGSVTQIEKAIRERLSVGAKNTEQQLQPDNGYVCNRPGSCAKGQGGKCYSGFDCPDKAIAG